MPETFFEDAGEQEYGSRWMRWAKERSDKGLPLGWDATDKEALSYDPFSPAAMQWANLRGR